MHTALYPVDELVGLAAVQQGPDGWKRVQDNGLGMSINIVLKHTGKVILITFKFTFFFFTLNKFTLIILKTEPLIYCIKK